MNGLSLAALTTKDDFSSMDEMPEFAFAVQAVVQADTSVNVKKQSWGSGVNNPETFLWSKVLPMLYPGDSSNI